MTRSGLQFIDPKGVSTKHTGLLALFLLLCISVAGCGTSDGNALIPASFVATGNMKLSRVGHTATLLNTGEVLMDGGGWGLAIDPRILNSVGQPQPVNVPAAGCEFYNPSSGVFTACLNPDQSRYNHTATLLQDGTVLIVGGAVLTPGTNPPTGSLEDVAEVFDPTTVRFSDVALLNTPRRSHTATLLMNGMVLIVGGQDTNGGILASAELYDPATKLFTYTGSLNSARTEHTATLLKDGRVLIAGGVGPINSILATAELYDPTTGSFSVAGSLNTARSFHTAALLSSGMVLVAGGYGSNSATSTLSSAELFNPATGTFIFTGSLNAARAAHTATLLSNGTVLIAGGNDPNENPMTSAEIYDPATGLFTTSTSGLNTARDFHTATLLSNGMVLLAGGDGPAATSPSPEALALSSAELY